MEVRPFTIHVSDDVLEDLRRRLGDTRFPDEIPGAGWDYGSNLDYLKALVHYWRTDFDWRAQEEKLNRLHHYKTPVDGLNIHFKLIEPQSWIVENNLGDPQKLGPCGGTTPNAGTPSGIVNKAQGAQKLHIKVQETVYHPGHYRIALAVSSAAPGSYAEVEIPYEPKPRRS